MGARIAEETSKAFGRDRHGIHQGDRPDREIASASKEQAQGIGQINQGLSQVDQVTANAEESASASEELSSQSLQLKQMLAKFKLKKQGFKMTAAGLPEGITPEMLQMLRSMPQPQQMPATAGPAMPSGFPGAGSPKNRILANRDIGDAHDMGLERQGLRKFEGGSPAVAEFNWIKHDHFYSPTMCITSIFRA